MFMCICVLGVGKKMACVFDQILRRFHDPEKVMNYCCKGPINVRLQSDGRWCIPKCSQGPGGP